MKKRGLNIQINDPSPTLMVPQPAKEVSSQRSANLHHESIRKTGSRFPSHGRELCSVHHTEES